MSGMLDCRPCNHTMARPSTPYVIIKTTWWAPNVGLFVCQQVSFWLIPIPYAIMEVKYKPFTVINCLADYSLNATLLIGSTI